MSPESVESMSVTSLGMPNPSQQGEALEYDQFIEALTPEQSKAFAADLARLYMAKKSLPKE
jgi:hypothetical protein